MRFDYRGVGESGGVFEEMTFESWREDVRFCAGWLRGRGEGPLVLHGLGMGAPSCAEEFCGGMGESLLMWAAPGSGRDVLHDALRRRLAIDFVRGERPKGRDGLTAELEAGRSIEVEGYWWSPELWRSADRKLPTEGCGGVGRPWKAVELDRTAEPLVGGIGLWQPLGLRAQMRPPAFNPPHRELFGSSLAWIEQALSGDCRGAL